MFAVLGDYPECIEVLLKHGSDPEVKDKSGRTALHWAAHHGNVQCLKVKETVLPMVIKPNLNCDKHYKSYIGSPSLRRRSCPRSRWFGRSRIKAG